MPRERTEVMIFTQHDLIKAAKALAKARVIGGYYIGEFGSQTAEWLDDGSLKVYTTHTPMTLEEAKRDKRNLDKQIYGDR